MNNPAPQNPYFNPIPRHHKTEEELEARISVVEILVYGKYSKRGEHRKETIEGDYEVNLEVPADWNMGHVKLAAQRYIKRELKGIRVRTFHVDKDAQEKPLEHQRRVRDFVSEKGLRDNERLKREYEREMAKRSQEASAMAQGIAPAFSDNSEYGADGLPKFSDKTYVAQ